MMESIARYIAYLENIDNINTANKILLLCLKSLAKLFPKSFVKTIISTVKLGKYVTISFDCDLHEDIKSYNIIFDILDKHHIKACFAVIGRFIEIYPEEHQMMVDEGHEILNHTYSHPHSQFNSKKFKELRKDELYKEIINFDNICSQLLQYKPIGYRAPHLIYRQDIYKILKNCGYIYSTSTIASKTKSLGSPYVIDDIIEIPLTPCPKYPFVTFTTWGLKRAQKKLYDEEEFYDLLKLVVNVGAKNNAYLNFYFDPCDVIHMSYFEEFLKILKKRGYCFLKYSEILEVIASESCSNRP